MDDKEKIRLVDSIIRPFLDQATKPITNIGVLKSTVGINGFKKAEPGTPVFEQHDRYMIMLESLDGKKNVELTYYKEALQNYIDFMPK